MKVETIRKKMSLEDKISLCSGKDFWTTKEFSKYQIPSIMMTDGPHGLRKQTDGSDMLGVIKSKQSTCFPPAVTAGATWNLELLKDMGKAIGEEAINEEVAIVLGPGINIKRNPLCGRNFEYYSEDPYIAGELGVAFVNGLQSTGVGCSVKHFAANSQEYKRFSSDSQMDDRTLREIYLAAFEQVVSRANPATVMCAYNKINGTYCSDNKILLTNILREEWGFQGLVVSDWGAMSNRMKAFEAGCDLCMPGGSAYQEKEAAKAVKEGKLKEEDIDKSVDRVLEMVSKGSHMLHNTSKIDNEIVWKRNNDLAYQIAIEGAVLLKNEENILPIKDGKKVLLVGHMAKELRYQGSGSSHINPTKVIQVVEALPDYEYFEGCNGKGEVKEETMVELEQLASQYEMVVVFAGLTDQFESEGFDRECLDIPIGHNKMIESCIKANRNTTVVLLGGGVMKLPWLNEVKGLLYMGLPGQNGGRAIADLLTGRANPCGKLTETWPLALTDVPSYQYDGKQTKNAQYREGIYVGYRYYDKAKKEVLFPFGYGLSYTRFEYSNGSIKDEIISIKIKNVGRNYGGEIVQLYIRTPQEGIHRPIQELKGFQKVFLSPGEEKTLEFTLTDRAFAIYQSEWVVPTGLYEIAIGASSRDIRCSLEMAIEGEYLEKLSWQEGSYYDTLSGTPSKTDWELLMGRTVEEDNLEGRKFTLGNTILELKDYSWLAKVMSKIVEQVVAHQMGIKPDYENQDFRMCICSSLDASLQGIIINSGGVFPELIAKRIIKSANRKLK